MERGIPSRIVLLELQQLNTLDRTCVGMIQVPTLPRDQTRFDTQNTFEHPVAILQIAAKVVNFSLSDLFEDYGMTLHFCGQNPISSNRWDLNSVVLANLPDIAHRDEPKTSV